MAEQQPPHRAAQVRANDAARCLWTQPGPHLHRASRLLSFTPPGPCFREIIILRAVPLAVLLPELFGDSPHSWFGPETRVVAGLALVFHRPCSFFGRRAVTADLLLLSRRLLQSVLGGSAGMRRGRAPQDLPRRALVPAHHAKCAPLFSLSPLLFIVVLSIDVWKAALVCRSGKPEKLLRHWNRNVRIADQRRPSRQFHVGCHALRMSSADFATSFRDRHVLSGVSLVSCFKPPPHPVAWLSLFWVGLHESVMCAFARWASGQIGGSCEIQLT